MSKPTPLQLAARNMDWGQVVMNGGPPCFQLCEDGRFCGRTDKWHGADTHAFISLEALITPTFCTIPPPGWSCTRKSGHKGPCAAIPTKFP